MAQLILEIQSRFGHEYHRIAHAITRIGRAFDNDIVLSDPTVSAHHFVLRINPVEGVSLHSIADENGIVVEGRKIEDSVTIENLPMSFDAGRTRMTIREPSQPVEPTRLLRCNGGGACIFGDWRWACLLFLLLFGFTAVDNYLSTPEQLGWATFWKDQMTIVIAAWSIMGGLIVVNRMTSHRWDFAGPIALISLLLLAAVLVDQLSLFLNYYFSSQYPTHIISLLWQFVLLPMALIWFLVRLNHGSTAVSLIIVLILLTPGAYLQSKESAAYFAWFDQFSKQAFYSEELYPWDIRRQNTISIETFIDEMKEIGE